MPGNPRVVPTEVVVEIGGDQYPVTAIPIGGAPDDGFDIDTGGRPLAVDSDWRIGDPVLRCSMNNIPQRFKVERSGLGYKLYHMGAEIDVIVYRTRVAELAKLMPEREPRDMSKFVQAPMPGLLRSLAVEEGDRVSPGAELGSLEAMKVERSENKRGRRETTASFPPCAPGGIRTGTGYPRPGFPTSVAADR